MKAWVMKETPKVEKRVKMAGPATIHSFLFSFHILCLSPSLSPSNFYIFPRSKISVIYFFLFLISFSVASGSSPEVKGKTLEKSFHLFLLLLQFLVVFCCSFVMGDHFVLLVDRLLTESTLGAAIESINQGSTTKIASLSIVEEETDPSPKKKFVEDGMSTGRLVECRICQDEDEDANMEIPCSCCGSLKYAHRKCVQKWCNEKGDTTCEICLQQFKPGYTAPPKLFLYGTSPMNFRGNWEISRQNTQNHQYIAITQTDNAYLRSNYNDYVTSHDRSIMYCRIIAATFMISLILRQSIPFMISGIEQYSIPPCTLLLLKTIGIVLPLYIMLRTAITFYQRRQLQEVHQEIVPESQMENGQLHSLQVMQSSFGISAH